MSQNHADDGGGPPSPALQFDRIARIYDELMSGVPYSHWVKYLQSLLKAYDADPSSVLDLCCGTGRVSVILARLGMQVSGVDISAGMIEQARKSGAETGLYIDYHVADAARMRLGRKFDLVVSLFDSLNYILDASVLQSAFYRVSEHLNPDGLFIFDMNTEVAFVEGLFNQSNLAAETAAVRYNWRSSYDRVRRVCRVNMDYQYQEDGRTADLEVVHYQRAYDSAEVESMLRSAGLKPLAVYDAYTLKKAGSTSDRVFHIAEKC